MQSQEQNIVFLVETGRVDLPERKERGLARSQIIRTNGYSGRNSKTN